jgi:hypothetical protein
MNRILLLIFVAGITFLVILTASRPDLFKEFWLWIVGLAGPAYKILQATFQKIKNTFQGQTGQTGQETAYHERQTKNVDESVG